MRSRLPARPALPGGRGGPGAAPRRALSSPHPSASAPWDSSGSKWWARAAPASVGAPAVAVVGRLVGLGFLGDGAALAALPGAALRGRGGARRRSRGLAPGRRRCHPWGPSPGQLRRVTLAPLAPGCCGLRLLAEPPQPSTKLPAASGTGSRVVNRRPWRRAAVPPPLVPSSGAAAAARAPAAPRGERGEGDEHGGVCLCARVCVCAHTDCGPLSSPGGATGGGRRGLREPGGP